MIVKALGAVNCAALVGIGALHFVWLRSPWPWRTDAEFREAVFADANEGPKPTAPAYIAVGAGLMAAGTCVAMQADLVPSVGPERLRAAGTWALSAALMARAVAGFIPNARRSPVYKRLNARYYSPLCLSMSGAAAAVQLARL